MRLMNLKNLPNNNLRNKSSFIRAKYAYNINLKSLWFFIQLVYESLKANEFNTFKTVNPKIN